MIDSHKTSNVDDCKIITLNKYHHENGNLSVVESCKEIPFELKRVYYIYDIPGGEERGGHSHRHCETLIFAVSGSFDIMLNDGKNKRTVSLNRPNIGLLVKPGIWRLLNNFSSGAVCLVLASKEYDENDYVRSFNEFRRLTSDKINESNVSVP